MQIPFRLKACMTDNKKHRNENDKATGANNVKKGDNIYGYRRITLSLFVK